MKKTILTLTLLSAFTIAKAQSKKDTSKASVYTFTEDKIIAIDQLLLIGDNAVASSDNYSKNQWKEYHNQILKIDSLIRSQYIKFHPAKEQPKKDKQ